MPVRPRIFRDPVHDIVSWKEEGALGELICALIDCPEMQRLRFVRQLGLASLVFHGAEHSRFPHSIGVAHVARTMCARFPALDEGERTATVAAALLHDVGHAPFSHVMERVFGFHHEARSVAIVLDPETAVHRALAAVDPELPDQVAKHVTGRASSWTRDVVSSQLDADRSDYLLRDAYMTGVEVGRYDLARILVMLDHDDEGLVVDERAFESVEGYLVARYHMYRLVYFHRAVRAAETMVECAFRRAQALWRAGDPTVIPPGPLGALMRGEEVPPSQWALLGDHAAWSLFAAWREHRDPVIALLASGLLDRRLFKANERSADGDESLLRADEVVEQEILAGLTADEKFLFQSDVAHDNPYRPYSAGVGGGHRPIRIRLRNGVAEPIEARSHLARALSAAGYRLRRWYYHPSLATRLAELACASWGPRAPGSRG